MNLRNQDAAIKNLETQIGELAKDFKARGDEAASIACKAVFAHDEHEEEQHTSAITNDLFGINYLQKDDESENDESLPCQLPEKDLYPRSFLLPCTIGNFKIPTLVDLGAGVNLISTSMFDILKLINLKETTMMIEMADTTKAVPKGVVDNVLLKIGKFLFLTDFVVIDKGERKHNNLIVGRPFLATFRAHIKVFETQISLGVGRTNYFYYE